MTSDPFKLVTDRRFQELRDEAHRYRLVQEVRTDAEPRARSVLSTLVEIARTVALRRRQRTSSVIEEQASPGVNARIIASVEVDVEAHVFNSLEAARGRTGT